MLLDSRANLGVYTPIKKLGEGLFGVSHLVRQQRQRQKRVLKLLHPLDGDPPEVSDERLRRLEADLSRYADLQHPNLSVPTHAGRVSLEDGREPTGVLYTVSDYVEGPDLYRYTARAAWSTILEVVVSLLRGLEALHCRGLVHGHLVSTNVIVSGQGPRKSARLLDPGFALEIFASRRLGHHASWAPEVLRGDPLDRRADLYDLGCLLFECATRARVFGAEDYEGLRAAHLTQSPPQVRSLKRSVPVAVEAMIDALLQKDPRARPASANAVIRELNKTASKRFSLEAREVRLAVPLLPLHVRAADAEQVSGWIRATCAQKRGEAVEAACALVAPAGQGRTRLLRDVRARCPVRWIEPREPSLDGLLSALCADGVPAAIQGQAPFLARHLPARVRAEGPPPAPVLEPGAERQRVAEAACRALLDVARREPLVVVLDGARFADPLLLDTLRLVALDLHQARRAAPPEEEPQERVGEVATDSPLGVLLSASTDELSGHPGSAAAVRRLLTIPGVRRVDLPALTGDALERVVAGGLGRSLDEVGELTEKVARVARRPGHALEILGELAERDWVPPPDGAWTLDPEALPHLDAGTEWPETLARRLSALALREPQAPLALRSIALLASEGRELSLSLLVEVLESDPESALGMLRELERRRWIEPIRPDRGLGMSASFAEVVLEAVPLQELPALHGRVGRAAATLAEGRGGAQERWGTLAATQLLVSDTPEAAVPHALRAARDAIRKSNPQLALRLLERGVDWTRVAESPVVPGVDALHPEIAWHQLHAEALLALGRAGAAASAAGKALSAARHHRLPRDVAASLLLVTEAQARQGDAQSARTTATEAGEVAHGTGWKRGQAEALRLRAQAEARLGDRGQAEASLEEARTLFSELGDQPAQADALRWRARLRLSAGDSAGALSLAEQALDLDEDGDCLSRLATTLRLKTRVLREQGELEKAQQLTRRSIRSAEDALDLSEVARGLVAGADLLSVSGDVRAGRARLEAALAVWERVGNSAGAAETRVRLGRAYLTTGELRAAEEQLAQAAQGFKPMADRSRTADVNASLAWTWLLRGDLAQAREHVDRALEDAQSAGTPGPRLEAQRVQAELYLAQGDLAGALDLARRTADEATRAALGRIEGRARIVIGGVLLAQGNSVEAERELREAFDLAEECGEGSLAARARLGIARVHLLRGEPAGTLGEVEKARDVAQSHQDAALEVQSLLALARMHLFLGQAKRAGTLADMARDRAQELDLGLYRAEAGLLRGAALLARVRAGEDDELLATSAALLEEAEREASARRGLQADANVVRAELELARNAVGAARERAESALEASRITDDRLTGLRAELALARVRRAQGRLEEARTAAEHALTAAEAARDSEGRARALLERGAALLALGALPLAGHDLREAASEIRGVWASLPEDLREDYQRRPLVQEVSQTAAELAEALERSMPAAADQEPSAVAAPPLPATATPSLESAPPEPTAAAGGVQLESLRDPLTNLFNHTFFTAQLETEIKRALRHSRPLALLKVNIDRFKLVRELYGAKTGKRVIREVAQLLLRHVRDVDIVARYFGDEFEVLLPDTDQRGALLTAERIREAAESFRFEHDQERVELTLSMGVAVFPHDAKDRDAIICRADEALYHARSRGSNSVFSFGASEEDLGESNAELRELDQLMLTREGRTILSMVQRLVNQELDIDHVIELVTGMVVEATRGERGFIMLKGGQDGEFRFRHGRNIDDKVINSPELKISNGIAKEVAETGRAIHVSEALEDQRFKDFKSVMDLNLRSIICAPIKQGDEVLGVIYVDHNQVARNFSQEDLNFLEAIAERFAIPLANSKKLRETEDRLAMAEARLRSQSAQLQTKYAYDTIVGRSEAMQRVFKLLDRIVETTHSVVIHGESGTGKELIARAIHYNGPRKNKPFVAENCAALSETLLEAELFGHVKGAFTGADRDSKGLFELANGGTLFLDEIGDMSERMQKKLLRVLQEGEVRPVGGKRVFHVDVRIISASNKDLKKLVQERKFREDLYYRLNVITVNLPPLRERNEDVVLLVEHFLEQHGQAGSPRSLDRETMQYLISYDWPGNVRELENEVNRLVAMSDDVASPDLLSPKIREGSKPVAKESEGLNRYLGRPLKDAEYEFMRELITHTLDQTNWHRTKAAKLLKVPTSTLFNKMKKYGIG